MFLESGNPGIQTTKWNWLMFLGFEIPKQNELAERQGPRIGAGKSRNSTRN